MTYLDYHYQAFSTHTLQKRREIFNQLRVGEIYFSKKHNAQFQIIRIKMNQNIEYSTIYLKWFDKDNNLDSVGIGFFVSDNNHQITLVKTLDKIKFKCKECLINE